MDKASLSFDNDNSIVGRVKVQFRKINEPASRCRVSQLLLPLKTFTYLVDCHHILI